ncbi:MAG: Type prenyl endopeptidase Rce1-like [Frankiaceae bacterium]|nr:Type prenyl endopeptidase Rce1-like [Frankiaceae bacterium]
MSAVVRRPVASGAVVALGCCLLLVRRSLLHASSDPIVAAAVLFTVLGVVGALWPVPVVRRATAQVCWCALAVGVAVFAAGRLIGGGHRPAVPTGTVLLLNSMAAISEELFFRRLVQGVLARRGAVIAAAGSALLFAAVHVPIYGFWVLPLDLGAGALLAWQRTATGTWTVPAVTHVLANLLVVI